MVPFIGQIDLFENYIWLSMKKNKQTKSLFKKQLHKKNINMNV